jgi:hypothetical protein
MKYVRYIFSFILIIWGSLFSLAGTLTTLEKKDNIIVGVFLIFLVGILPLYFGIRIFLKTRAKYTPQNDNIDVSEQDTQKSVSPNTNIVTKKKLFSSKRIFETPTVSTGELIIDKTNDFKQLRAFIDEWSLKSGRVIDYLGSHMNILSVTQEPIFLLNYDVLTIFRPVESIKQSGKNYEEKTGNKDPYLFDYETPNDFKNSKVKDYKVMLSTVKTFSCEKLITCNTCHGSGNCNKCNGKGKLTCGSCGGKGEIRHEVRNKSKSGTHIEKSTCNSCNGSGKRTCSTCAGRGKCNLCTGSGKLTCPTCEGSGNYQTFDAFKSEYYYDNKKFVLGMNDLTPDELSKAVGNSILNKIVLEYKTLENISLNELNSIEEIIPMNYKENLLKIKYLSNEQKGKLCKLKVGIQKYNSIQVKYLYDDKEYFLEIFGNNHIIFAPSLPNRSFKEKFSIQSIIKFLTRRKRYLSYLRISIFILWSDDELAEDEKNLFLDMMNSTPLKENKKSELLKYLDSKLTFEDIKIDLDYLKKDKYILTFIWHMINADGVIAEKELESFNQIVTYYSLSNKEVEKIKSKISGFMRLDTKKLIKEYVEK